MAKEPEKALVLEVLQGELNALRESVMPHRTGMRSMIQAGKPNQWVRARTGYQPGGSGADYHFGNDALFYKRIEWSRDMDMNDAIIGSTVDRSVVQTVRKGFTARPMTSDPGLNTELTNRFWAYSTDPQQCDFYGEMTFRQMEAIVLRSVQVDGDICALPIRGQLQLIEAHRLKTATNTRANVVYGVKLDDNRRRLEYWFSKDDVRPTQSVQYVDQVEKIPAFDKEGNRRVFHVMNPRRVTQTRGLMALSCVFDFAGMFEDSMLATMVQRQMVSAFGIVKTTEAKATPSAESLVTGSREQLTRDDGSTETRMKFSPGRIWQGAPGEKLEGFSPNIPNPEYFPHMKLILTIIAINLGLPFQVQMMDASDTNFSGWRGAFDLAKAGFQYNQCWLEERFHQPAYRAWLGWLITNDHDFATSVAVQKCIRDGTLYHHEWGKPAWPYVQPLQDVQTDIARIAGRQVSPRRLAHERGYEYNEIITETIEDNLMAIDLANAARSELIRRHPGIVVDWREILNLPGTKPVSGTLALGADSGEAGADPKPETPAKGGSQ